MAAPQAGPLTAAEVRRLIWALEASPPPERAVGVGRHRALWRRAGLAGAPTPAGIAQLALALAHYHAALAARVDAALRRHGCATIPALAARLGVADGAGLARALGITTPPFAPATVRAFGAHLAAECAAAAVPARRPRRPTSRKHRLASA